MAYNQSFRAVKTLLTVDSWWWYVYVMLPSDASGQVTGGWNAVLSEAEQARERHGVGNEETCSARLWFGRWLRFGEEVHGAPFRNCGNLWETNILLFSAVSGTSAECFLLMSQMCGLRHQLASIASGHLAVDINGAPLHLVSFEMTLSIPTAQPAQQDHIEPSADLLLMRYRD